MTIVELARRSGFSAETVRYYARIGVIQPIRQKKNGYRIFSDEALCRLGFIKQAKLLGFTLKDIRLILNEAQSGKSPCPLVRTIIKQRIDDTRRRLTEMAELLVRMEKAHEHWGQIEDAIPDGNTVCVLIERFHLESS